MHPLGGVQRCGQALLEWRDQRPLKICLRGESLLQSGCIVRSSFILSARGIENPAHCCIYTGGIRRQAHRLLRFLQRLRWVLFGEKNTCLLSVRQRRSEWNLEVSFIHKDTRV